MDSPETLLEHATWLRRLAAGLVGDRTVADDLVQDTWLAALTHPPDQSRSVRPWLARVVRNAARFRWRGDANRVAREAVAAEGMETMSPTSEELLARHELQQLLAKLVGELDEPFRATILLRYAEGLEPTQIARKLSIPAGTVRWRIKEGLERLRQCLDHAYGGDRRRWLLALAPISLWPHTSHGATVPIGLASAAVVALAIVASAAHDSNSVDIPSENRSSIARVDAQRIAPPRASTWFVQAGAATRHVTGRVVREGAPVVGALVRLVADEAEAMERRTDAKGRFDFGVQAPRTIILAAGTSNSLASIRHLDLRDPIVSTDVELPLLECSARITGKVADANGTAIAQAQVLRENVFGTETDSNGMYELCVLPTAALVAQLDLFVRADGYGTLVVGVAPAGRLRRDFVLAPEATITGTTSPNAAIWIEPDRDDPSRTGERGVRQVAIADADGHFRITGASGGRYRIGGASRGAIAVPMLVSVGAGGTTDVTIRMVPAATVRGSLLVQGKPVSGARVAVRSDTDGVVVLHDDPSGDQIATGHAITQLDGSFVLDGVPIGHTSFTAAPVRVVNRPAELIAGDNSITLEGQPLGRIRGVVRRHGVPVPYARIDINGPTKRGITSDGTGRYDLDGLEVGRYSFYADDQRRGAYIAGAMLTIGNAETRDYDIELAWGAQIAGIVVDSRGAPVADVNVRFTAEGEQARCATNEVGAFTCGSLKGGASYSPTVLTGDDATRPLPFVASAPPVELGVDGSVSGLRLAVDPRTTTIVGRVVDETGAPAIDVRVRALGDGLHHYAWSPAPTMTTDHAGRFRFDRLAPGDYALDAETLHDRRSASVVVAAGADDIVLRLVHPTCVARPPIDPPSKPVSPIIWDDRIELVGWDLPSQAVIGESITVTLVFRVRAPILHAWQLFAHFDSSEHRTIADHSPVSDACPTSTWKPGDVLVDRFSTKLGFTETFSLKIGFFRPGESDGPWQNLAGVGATGIRLGEIRGIAPEN